MDSETVKKVLVAIPSLGWIHSGVVIQIVEMMKNPHGHKVSFAFRAGKPVDSVRNAIIKDFLEKDFDFLLFIDTDNPPVRNPLKLVELDLDIVILPTPIWYSKIAAKKTGKQPIIWNAMHDAEDPDTGDPCWQEDCSRGGVREIDAGGSGAMLIARRALEAFRPAFMREFDEWGRIKRGSDFLFCQKARKAGFRVWAHWDHYCQHYKEIDLADVYRVMQERDISNAGLPNINTPEFWDEHWEKTKDQPQHEVHDAIISHLNGDKKVLDVGCGRGDLLAKLGNGACGLDWSPKAVELAQKSGLNVKLGTEPEGWWDCIICCDMLQMVEDDRKLLEKFFEHTNKVVYAVPYDCLPPGLVVYHRRVYTPAWIERITPHLKKAEAAGEFIVVLAEKEA
jgi:SAM-dependent methyltransferase